MMEDPRPLTAGGEFLMSPLSFFSHCWPDRCIEQLHCLPALETKLYCAGLTVCKINNPCLLCRPNLRADVDNVFVLCNVFRI